MKPNRVPDDLLQAAGDAIRAWYAGRPDYNSYLDDRTQMRLVIAAALTVHNEQVEQPLRERADAAEAQLKAVMQYTHEIGEVQAGLPSYEAAVARAGYWQALQRIAAQNAEDQRNRAEAAERELAELRAADDENIGTEKRPLTKRELRDIGMAVVGPLKYVPERWDHGTVARLYWALMQQRGEAIVAKQELAELRERTGEEREEWAIRTAAGAEAFCATREGALRIAADWTRIRNDGPWRAESRAVGEWKAAEDGQ